MTRLEAWFTHVTTILVTITGLVYAYMHYVMKSNDPFSVVNHPWEPYMMDAHIVVSPFLVLAIGMLVNSHILAKLQSNGKTARKSGIFLIPLFIIMVLSGYLLQVITASWKNIVIILHLVSGTLWSLIYLAHYIASFQLRKLMQASAAFSSEEPQPKGVIPGKRMRRAARPVPESTKPEKTL